MTIPATPPGRPARATVKILTDGVVSLAPFELSDATTVMSWDADPDVQRAFDWPLTPTAADPATRAARLSSAEQMVRAKRARWESGEEFAFLIHRVVSGEGLGWIDLKPRGAGRGNVAYGILAEHRRKGAATRSVALVSRFAFDVLGWARLEIRTSADNVASRSVAIKAGFRLEGIMRSYGAYERHEPLLGERFDEAVYSRILADR